ncbi:type IV pilus modification PilV family protein [Oceanobacillus bengalensis]|uniref:Prepilin-type N-terminal cleavage/methylation domain-containing protein n=1 Tax=Oceanobacillus bengalensis TaxID=1435466 RepID=A0A494YWQ8_9BACI|nr:prepilin-type N-terminal cleavage/methylation domain-containing protein [Oceanobacillus bengalensis]RKQ14657.1 prepilin-type N-terminal cleavage/methylation domain-containing protein [Oceanobacillus bengalensis]
MRRNNAWFNNEQGFTLVEVLASLTIISVILVGSYNLIIFTNQAAVSNNDRLVAINLGKATLERVKIQPTDYFALPTDVIDDTETFSNATGECDQSDAEDSENPFCVKVNDKIYSVTVEVSQTGEEFNYNLIDVTVIVVLEDENITHQLEGYVSYDSNQLEE